MDQQVNTLDLVLSIGVGLLCGYALTKILKIRPSATSLFIMTLLAVCSTWLGPNCCILNIEGVFAIVCSAFLQSMFFAGAIVLALQLNKHTHTTAQHTH